MPKRSAADAAETRRTIVAQAAGLFAARGFERATTADIAAAAGVTEGAVFHHFRTKRDIFAEVVRDQQARFHDAVSAVGRGEAEPRAAFLAGARAALGFSQGGEYRRIVLIEAPSVLGSAMSHEIDSGFGVEVIAPALAAVAGDGALRPARLHALTLLVLGFLNETALALARGEERADVDASMALLNDLLVALVDPTRPDLQT